MERPILIQARTASGRRKEHGSPSFFENAAIIFVNLCLYSFDPFKFFYCFILGPYKAYFLAPSLNSEISSALHIGG